jgi:elongation factor G
MIAGFPLSGLRITFLGGEHREDGSDEVAFRIATADAFDQVLRQGSPVLLEPLMKLEVTTPDQYMGDIVGDLQMRRGIVSNTDARGTMTAITAIAPLKELFGYSGAIRSLSQGRAAASMEPCGYEAAPARDQEEFG